MDRMPATGGEFQKLHTPTQPKATKSPCPYGQMMPKTKVPLKTKMTPAIESTKSTLCRPGSRPRWSSQVVVLTRTPAQNPSHHFPTCHLHISRKLKLMNLAMLAPWRVNQREVANRGARNKKGWIRPGQILKTKSRNSGASKLFVVMSPGQFTTTTTQAGHAKGGLGVC